MVPESSWKGAYFNPFFILTKNGKQVAYFGDVMTETGQSSGIQAYEKKGHLETGGTFEEMLRSESDII